MPLDPIGLTISEIMQKPIEALIVMPHQWTAKEIGYLQRIQTSLIQFSVAWQSEEETVKALHLELRTTLSTILGFSEILIEMPSQTLEEETLKQLHYILSGGRALLALTNSFLSKLKHQDYFDNHPKTFQSTDIDSLFLIDNLLDIAIELRLHDAGMSNHYTSCLEALHKTFLSLHEYIQIFEFEHISEIDLLHYNHSFAQQLVKLIRHDYPKEIDTDLLHRLENLLEALNLRITPLVTAFYMNKHKIETQN